MTVKTDVYIDGVKLPTCEEGGISVTLNKLYASNAGRSNTTGEFIGDIVALKYDVNLTWLPLYESEMHTLSSLADTAKVEHTVKMMFNGKEYEERECYIADFMRVTKIQTPSGILVYENPTMHIVEI